jgi:hypothetical protein
MSNIHPIHQLDNILEGMATIATQKKSELELAKKAFDDIQKQIIDYCGHKEEGAAKFNTENFTITTTGKLNRSIDESKLAELQNAIPQPLFDRLFNYKPALNLRELRYIEQNEPEYYKTVSKVITTKPGKPSLKIEASK